MIVTVTANPALDVSYGLADSLNPGGMHQAISQLTRPGGKGLNITRMLTALDQPVEAIGMCGGPGSITLRGALNDHEIAHDFVDVLPDVRRMITFNGQDGQSTTIHEQAFSPDNPRHAARLLIKTMRTHLDRADVVAVCGDNPPHIDSRFPALLTNIAGREGKLAVADVSGAALRDVIEAGTAVVVTHVRELADLAGRSLKRPADVTAFAGELVERYRLPAVVTLTDHGVVAVYTDGACWSRLSQRFDAESSGASDAVCAAVLRHLATTSTPDWPEAVTDAAALCASAAHSPDPGQIDLKAYLDLKPTVTTELSTR
jgi:1-phosphofructokinase family hexose kinase